MVAYVPARAVDGICAGFYSDCTCMVTSCTFCSNETVHVGW